MSNNSILNAMQKNGLMDLKTVPIMDRYEFILQDLDAENTFTVLYDFSYN